MARAPRLEDYTIILFCPLVIEQQAACLILDEIHDGIPERLAGQTVLYTLGRIASHNVAIAGYPVGEAGIGISGSMVSEALRDFPNLEAGLLVGIAAGIPSPTRDIRLGDVAIAVPSKDNPGVIGYDLVKVEEGEVRLKQWQNATHSLLRSVITSIQVHEARLEAGFTRHLDILNKAPSFRPPGIPPCSDEFPNPSRRSGPRAHYGTILSGNGVIKSRRRRDELRDRYDGIAIEMEAAGMLTRLPVAVIRGISDFADANKNDDWHAYAAVTAAAYAKEMLTRLGPRKATISDQSVISSGIEACLRLALPEQCSFVGRGAELAILEKYAGFCSNHLPQKSIITVWGLSGVGKSQLVSEFVKRQRESHLDYEIFWVNGETKETFEQSIVSLLKASVNPTGNTSEVADSYHEQRGILVNSFFTELRSPGRSKWLLVIDGLLSVSSMKSHIRGYIDSLPHGSIILVTRSKDVAFLYNRRVEVKGLPEADAVKLLTYEIENQFGGQDEDVVGLARMLKCHPLSLKLATSALSYYPLSVAEYVERWNMRQLGDENFQTNQELLRSFEISFDELERTNPFAAKLLMLFGFLDHRDMWQELCLSADNDDYPGWLRYIVSHGRFQECFVSMRNLSFIEAKPHPRRKEFIYEIHPAVHEFARWKAMSGEEEYIKCAISLVASKVPRTADRDFLDIAKRLEPHAEQCKIYMEQDRAGDCLDLVELEKFGNLFRQLGRYEDASQLYNGISNILVSEIDPDDSTMEMLAGIENNMGLVHHAQRKYDIALRSLDFSYQRQIMLSMPDQDAQASTLYNKGRCLLMLGRLDEALELLSDAKGHFHSLVPYHNRNAHGGHEKGRVYYRILNDIGEIYLRKQNLEQAEQHFREAFDGQKRCLHETHPATYAVRLNIGRVCVERSLFSTANRIFQFIIAQYTEWWGRGHSETMRAVAELADSYRRHGEMKRLMGDGGEEQLLKATELWKELLSFHLEAYGEGSDTAGLARSRLQELHLLGSMMPEDPYSSYYS